MIDSLGQCFILSLLQVVYCVRFCFFVLFSVCLVRYVLFGLVRISLFRWSVRFSVRRICSLVDNFDFAFSSDMNVFDPRSFQLRGSYKLVSIRSSNIFRVLPS